jgi:Xaa-Pro dipeptidase
MNFQQRLAVICERMREERVELLIGVHDGTHFIETPNPVMAMSGFKSLGAAAVLLRSDGSSDLIVTPAWDAERAAECCPNARVVGANDIVDALLQQIDARPTAAIGIAGLRFLASGISERIVAALPGGRAADAIVFDAARTKTIDEIAHAREAARIAERGYQHLLAIARPGLSEDELAVALKWHMKMLGAEDNFLMLCAGLHNKAVQPSTGRKLQSGDIPRRDHAQLSGPARTDLPDGGGRSRFRRTHAQIRAGGARHESRHRRRRAGRSYGGRLPRH